MNYLELVAIKNLPYIKPGDDLSKIINNALIKEPISIDDGDVIIVAQKIISKSENRYVDLSCISASRQAIALGKKLNKDPRFIQIILNESNEIISIEKNVIIVEHKLGFVHINAGIDRSNISQKIDQVLLLPKNPALSSQQLQVRLSTLLQKEISVIVTDSMTRPYRSGITNFALASSNIQSLINISSEKDIR